MNDVLIRIEGHAGRITLNRPKALNALTWKMIRAIDTALVDWAENDAVSLVIIDAAGDRAFAAGGDIVELYQTGMAGDYRFGQTFWAEEYRLNARIATYPKPFVALMHGFVMGGGVGVSCHGSHRIVCETTQVAMPECGIGLIPDVGGTWLLAQSPVGPFVGLTGFRMGPADAIFTKFADTYVPKAKWHDLIRAMSQTGSVAIINDVCEPAPDGMLQDWAPDVSRWFLPQTLAGICQTLSDDGSDTAHKHKEVLRKQSPLAVACGLVAIRAAKDLTLTQALAQEYRFVSRCMEHGDFLEGIRAQIIDKDRTPKWRHSKPEDVTSQDVTAMLAPLDTELDFH